VGEGITGSLQTEFEEFLTGGNGGGRGLKGLLRRCYRGANTIYHYSFDKFLTGGNGGGGRGLKGLHVSGSGSKRS
jgi:hypothetical protein